MTHSQLCTRVVVSLLGLMLVGCARPARPAPAAEATSRPAQPEEAVTLLYDMRDLLVPPSPDFQVASDEHGWPRYTSSATGPSTREEIIESLITLIMDIVDTPSWRGQGDGPGSIHEEAGQFVVTQTPANHAQLKRLLDQLRDARSYQITVQSFVIRGDDVWKQTEHAGGDWRDLGESMQMRQLTAEQVRRLVEGRKQDPVDWTYLTVPRLTLFNGQRAFVIVASETPYVAGYAPGGGALEGRKLEPVTKTVSSGVAIDCRATVSTDRMYVTLELHPRLSTLRDVRSVPLPHAPEGQNLQIQVPHLTTAAVDITVSVPDQHWVLLRTVPRHQPADAGAAPEEPVLFAFGATVFRVERE